MENKFSTIKDRVIQIIEYYGFTKTEFCSKIGITTANLRGNAKKTPLNSDTIENIFTICPQISPDWLLTGKGEMERQPSGDAKDSLQELLLSQQRTIENLSETIRNLTSK